MRKEVKILISILVFIIISHFLFLTDTFAFSFSGFIYPTSSTGKNIVPITLGLGESWDFASGHLGEDYFLSENADVYAVADGVVFKVADWPECPFAKSYGWGGVVIIKHQIPDNIDKKFNTEGTILKGSPAISYPKVVYSMYAHLKNIRVKNGQKIKKGDKLGEVGRVCMRGGGTYIPHLHFEIKDQNAIIKEWEGIGRGYSTVTGYAPNRYIPSKFIENNKNLIIVEPSLPAKPIKKTETKAASVTPTSAGALSQESALSIWDKILFHSRRLIDSIKDSFEKSNSGLKENKKNTVTKKEKEIVWRQKLIDRIIPRVTFVFGESSSVNGAILKFKNTGTTVWKRDEVFLNVIGGYTGTAAKLYHKSWITRLRPCTFKEKEVKPGEIGTFEFLFSYPQKEGKYYAQFSLSRYDKKRSYWYWIEGDRAIIYITVKLNKKTNLLNFSSANILHAFSNKNKDGNIGLDIKDLIIFGEQNEADLVFTPPKEDQVFYEVYFSTEPFNQNNFSQFLKEGSIIKLEKDRDTILPYIKQVSLLKNGKISIKISNLFWNYSNYFAIRAVKGNISSKISNVVFYKTPASIFAFSFPMLQYNASKKGQVPFEGPHNNFQIEIFLTGDEDRYFSAPAIDSKGNFYFIAKINGKEGLYSFDYQKRQRFFIEGRFPYHQPTLLESQNLLFGVKENSLIAADATTGKILWERKFPVIKGNEYPIVDDFGRVYMLANVCLKDIPCTKEINGVKMANFKSGLIVIEPKYGEVLWFYSFSENKKYQNIEIDFNQNNIDGYYPPEISISPSIDKNGLVYVGYNNKLLAINSRDGKLLNEKNFSATSCREDILKNHFGPYLEYIAVDEKNVYISVREEVYRGCGSWSEGWRTCFHSLNKFNLEENWENPFCETEYYFAPFAVSLEGDIFLAPAWYNAFAGGFAYSYLLILSPTGDVKKTVNIENSGLIEDIIVDKNKNIYVLFGGVYSDHLEIFDNNLELKKKFMFSYPNYSSYTFSLSPDKSLYIGSNGKLYRIFQGE